MNEIKVDIVGLLPLQRQMELLTMGTNRRRRLLYRVAQKVIRDSRKRIRQQVGLNGLPFKERWKPRSDRRRMLSRLSQRMSIINNDSVQATIGFRGGASGKIAAKQQYGATERVTADQNRRQSKSLSKHYDQPATRKQAKALRDAGFKVKAGGKAKIAPISWITDHLTVGQAGYALRRLREWSGEKAKTSWLTVLPARAFLGATDAEVSAHIDSIFEDMTKELQRGIR